jgi:hypothetical protein
MLKFSLKKYYFSTNIFFLKENEESDGIFENISFFRMESSKPINYLTKMCPRYYNILPSSSFHVCQIEKSTLLFCQIAESTSPSSSQAEVDFAIWQNIKNSNVELTNKKRELGKIGREIAIWQSGVGKPGKVNLAKYPKP